MKYVCYKHSGVSNLHKKLTQVFFFNFFFANLFISEMFTSFTRSCFPRNAAFRGRRARFERGATFKNNRWSPQKQSVNLSITQSWYDCLVLLFCFHFILTYIHPLRLSALCMPVQHSRGPPGEQTHTAGYVGAQQSPSPFPFCLLRSHRGPASMPRQSTLWPGRW